jgi:hypothetical protein
LIGSDVADQVAHRRIGGGELLAVPLAAVLPGDRREVAVLLGQRDAARTYRGVWMIVDLAAADDRSPLVEQAGERADEPRLALAALAEQHQIVPGEQGTLDLGCHGLVEADDAGQRRLARREAGDQVAADLGLDAAMDVARAAKFAERCDGGGGHRFDATWRLPCLPGTATVFALREILATPVGVGR